jgi:hypothetical protein
MVARSWRLFLLHSVAIVSSVVAFVIPGFRRTADAWLRINAGKVFPQRADGLDGKGSGGLHAIIDDGLPDAKPVLEMVDGRTFNVLVEVGGGGSKEDIFVSMKDLVTLVMDVVEGDGELAAAGDFTGFCIRAVDSIVAEFPHRKVLDPDSCDDGGGPEEARGAEVCSFNLMEVLVLESGPFEAQAALEELTPP